MANYSTLKAAVADVVKTNGTQAITGANLQAVLLSIINSVGGGGYIFKGVATPSTSAGTPDENVFYLGGAGTYANFGASVTVPVGSICVFKYNGSWTNEQIETSYGGVFDISEYHATGGTLATYADLAAALGNGGANVPSEIRKGGMCISFVQSSDNKYVQARCMANEFTTDVTQWQGVDEEPTVGSNNLVESGGTKDGLLDAESHGNIYDANIQPYGLSTTKWNANPVAFHIVIPVLPNMKVGLNFSGGTLYYTFTKSYSRPKYDDEAIDLCDGYSRMFSNSNIVVTCPSDAKYLIVGNAKAVLQTLEVSISHKVFSNGLYRCVENLAIDLNTLQESFSSLATIALKESDLGLVMSSNNIANPNDIIPDYNVGSTGYIGQLEGWGIIKIDVSSLRGQYITCGRFYLGRGAYYAFYKEDDTLDSYNSFPDPNGGAMDSILVPSNAKWFYLDIKTTFSPSNPYSQLTINVGQVLLDYEPYEQKISTIKGYEIAGTGGESAEMQGEIEDLQQDVERIDAALITMSATYIANLPVDDGTGVNVGEAYIDSQTSVVKVRLS